MQESRAFRQSVDALDVGPDVRGVLLRSMDFLASVLPAIRLPPQARLVECRTRCPAACSVSTTALVVVLSALGFAMAVWVNRANPRERENQGFSLMVLFIVTWVSCYHLAQRGDPTFWFRLAACAVFLFFVTYYFFIVQWFLGKSGLPYRLFGVVSCSTAWSWEAWPSVRTSSSAGARL